MHEKFRQRLAMLEEARGLRERAAHVVSIIFPGMESTHAEANGFTCYRDPFETLGDFQDRAERELMAFDPHPKVPPILVFLGDRGHV
jgi:hypothetical protein